MPGFMVSIDSLNGLASAMGQLRDRCRPWTSGIRGSRD